MDAMAILAVGRNPKPISSPQVQGRRRKLISPTYFMPFHPYNGYGGPINGSDVNALNSENSGKRIQRTLGARPFPMTMAGPSV